MHILFSLVVVVAGGIPEVEEVAAMEGIVTVAETVAIVVVPAAMAAVTGATVVVTVATAAVTEATAVVAEIVATNPGATGAVGEAVVTVEGETVTAAEVAVAVMAGDMVRDTVEVEVGETVMEVMAAKGVEPTETAVVAPRLEEVVEGNCKLPYCIDQQV